MKRILICEDEQDAQTSLQSIFTKRNYEVTSVSDGKSAIDQAKSFKPDLILLDIRMPKIDGLEVAREVRDFDKLVKILFVSAFSSPEIKREAVKYNIVDYLTKPVPTETLVQSVEQALK